MVGALASGVSSADVVAGINDRRSKVEVLKSKLAAPEPELLAKGGAKWVAMHDRLGAARRVLWRRGRRAGRDPRWYVRDQL